MLTRLLDMKAISAHGIQIEACLNRRTAIRLREMKLAPRSTEDYIWISNNRQSLRSECNVGGTLYKWEDDPGLVASQREQR